MAGIWALLLPHTFYDDFPLPGHDWVAMLPPYNLHLITDVGELSLALAFMLATATLTPHRLLVRTVLAGYLFYTVPHLVFHARHLGSMPPGDATAETIVLSITVALPLALLSLAIKPQPESQSAARPSTGSTPGPAGTTGTGHRSDHQ